MTHTSDQLSDTQYNLLRACFEDNQKATIAYERWSNGVDLDVLPVGDFHLLPRLYKNISRDPAFHHEWLGRIKGIRRRTWYANQLLWQGVQSILLAFKDKHIDIVVLDEFALMAYCESDLGLLTTSGIKLLVRRNQLEEAQEQLVRSGWTLSSKLAGSLSFTEHLRIYGGLWFVSPEGRRLRLVSSWLPHSENESCWERTREVDLGGINLTVLCATDQLLRCCTVRRFGERNLLHVRTADCALILENSIHESNPIDWQQFMTDMGQAKATHSSQVTLSAVNQLLPNSIPKPMLSKLLDMPVERSERVEFSLRSKEKRTVWERFFLLYTTHKHAQTELSFLQFLKRRFL